MNNTIHILVQSNCAAVNAPIGTGPLRKLVQEPYFDLHIFKVPHFKEEIIQLK